MDVKEKVKIFVEKQGLIERGDRILLGLSGGADSVCLFYLLLEIREELGFRLRAVHVHHGIRAEAEEDAAYVRELCGRENVFCYLFHEDVPSLALREGLSEEEAGRAVRYRDFEESLKSWREEEAENCRLKELSAFKIATAHHENDQAETVLFQLFRGCGLAGLRGIVPRRENIIRPILCLSREEIEGFLRKKGITWREDQTNRLENYSRNKIRHRILPYAEAEICRGATAHIGKTAGILREAEEYIKRQVKEAYRRTAKQQEGMVAFDIVSLRREDVFLQKQLLLYGLEQILAARKDIGIKHIEDILKLAEKQGNGELFLPDSVRVRKIYSSLLLFREGKDKTGRSENASGKKGEELSDFLSGKKGEELSVFPVGIKGVLYCEKKPEIRLEQIDLTGEEAVKKRFGIQNIAEIIKCIPQKEYTKWFDYDKIEMPFSIRHRESGDYLTIDREMNRKSLRRYMMENKIPVSRRDRIWILADGPHVIWVPGGRISTYYKVTDQTKTILQIQICVEE